MTAHTTPSEPAWVEWTADLERRIKDDYSRASNRITVRRFKFCREVLPPRNSA